MNSYERGKISELMARAELMRLGYEVYEGFYGTYDFLVMKGQEIKTVEVKTSPKLQIYPLMYKNKPDILVLVNLNGTVKIISLLAH
jgi:hypothetical protein